MTFPPVHQSQLAVAEGWRDYTLLDVGGGRRLETVGKFTLVRPDAQSLGAPLQPENVWRSADATFSGGADDDDDTRGRWRFQSPLPDVWPVHWQDITLNARCTPFRHLGFFPEQAAQWRAISDWVRPGSEVLNLFGYTGAASLVAAKRGARVTHVDASKKSIGYARENQTLSGLDTAPVRWIVDDALGFLRREVRRGRQYDGVILDPPKHGRGPNGEVWKIEEGLEPLLSATREVIQATKPSERPSFIILTLYALRLSHLALARVLSQTMTGMGGTITAGDMALPIEGGGFHPTAIYARWHRD
jgi:23S rRNA (cytosine1962-C5)-methyltransferase